MDPNYQKGMLLLEQSRYSQAEVEFRQSILNNGDYPFPRAMLALCLTEQERFKEAESELGEALRLAPDFPFLHYVRARILSSRNRPEEAQLAISEAIRLDPEEADFRAFEAQIHLNQQKWQAALQSAEAGLALDAEHVTCANLRAIALVKLGRRAEAGQAIESALAKDPENSVTHANQGWKCLHDGNHQQALEHFREALRIDPENDWARQGIVEALKARYFIYSWMLKYFLWMSRLSGKLQWGVILGGYFGIKIVSSVQKSNPDLAPYLSVVKILYLAFVFLTWTAEPLFNLLLRVNKFGRMALNNQEITASNWVGGFVGLALLSLAVGLTVFPPLIMGALVFGFGVLPLAAIFKCPAGWPKFAMTAYTAVVVGAGIIALSLSPGAEMAGAQNRSKDLIAFFFLIFGLGILASGWIANFLMMVRVRK